MAVLRNPVLLEVIELASRVSPIITGYAVLVDFTDQVLEVEKRVGGRAATVVQ
jgi:hypothetical protein